MLSLDSRRLLKFLIAYLEKGERAHTMLNIFFYYTFYRSEPKKQGLTDIDHGIRSIVACEAFKDEILEVLKYNISLRNL